MSTSPASDNREPAHAVFGFGAIDVSADEHTVTLVANPDGLVELAQLFLRLACADGPREYVHLHPTLQLSPESFGLRVARNDEGLLPDGRRAPSWDERLRGWDAVQDDGCGLDSDG